MSDPIVTRNKAARERLPQLVGTTAPLFSIGGAITYAIPAGASLPSLLLDLQHLLSACEGIMTTIAEDLTSPGLEGGPAASSCAAYWGGLMMLRQSVGITSLAQVMTEFPDRPEFRGVVAAGCGTEGGAA